MARRAAGSAASQQAASHQTEAAKADAPADEAVFLLPGDDTIIAATDEFYALLSTVAFDSRPHDGGFDSWNFFTFG